MKIQNRGDGISRIVGTGRHLSLQQACLANKINTNNNFTAVGVARGFEAMASPTAELKYRLSNSIFK